MIEEANEAAASDAGLPPALTATGDGEALKAAPAGQSVAHAKTVAAGRLIIWVRRNAAARLPFRRINTIAHPKLQKALINLLALCYGESINLT
jgi:hypothetical protein